MSSNSKGEGDVRKNLIENDLVDCMVSLPGNLFYGVTIPCCLWFLTKNKKPKGLRDRSGEILFIDARKIGILIDRVRRDFSDEDVAKISDTYHAWCGQPDVIERSGKYENVSGFCQSTNLQEIKMCDYILTPGRFVGTEEDELDDEVSFEEKLDNLRSVLKNQFDEAKKLEEKILSNLRSVDV